MITSKELLAKNLNDYQEKINSLFDKLNGDVKEEVKSDEVKKEKSNEANWEWRSNQQIQQINLFKWN